MIPDSPERQAERRQRVRTGLIVATGLAVLTVIEYVIAVQIDRPLWWLVPIALVKGWLILDYFMHIRALFGDEGIH